MLVTAGLNPQTLDYESHALSTALHMPIDHIQDFLISKVTLDNIVIKFYYVTKTFDAL